MIDAEDLDRPDVPLVGLYRGVVMDRSDPLTLGRVRVRIPGLIDEGSAWALPLGTVGGGDTERGFYAVPELDAEVGVLFHRGNIDEPHYLCGNWGRQRDGSVDVPTTVKEQTLEDAPNVRSFETPYFELSFDDNTSEQAFALRHKATGTQMIIDGQTGSLSITSLGNMLVEATGILALNGLVVTINGKVAGLGSV
jgi:hypothetical protein